MSDAQVTVNYVYLFEQGLYKWLRENIGPENQGWWYRPMDTHSFEVPIHIVDENLLIQFKLCYPELVKPIEREQR